MKYLIGGTIEYKSYTDLRSALDFLENRNHIKNGRFLNSNKKRPICINGLTLIIEQDYFEELHKDIPSLLNSDNYNILVSKMKVGDR